MHHPGPGVQRLRTVRAVPRAGGTTPGSRGALTRIWGATPAMGGCRAQDLGVQGCGLAAGAGLRRLTAAVELRLRGSAVAPRPAGSFAQGELLSGFAHKSQGLTEIQFAAEKCWFRLWKNNSLVGVLGGEQGGQGTGGAGGGPCLPCHRQVWWRLTEPE